MYMTITSVAPGNVRFAVPDLALPEVRELSAWEIDAVSAGAITIDYQRAVTIGGFGAFFGGIAGSFGGLLGTGAGAIAGFAGGFVTDIAIQILDQL